MTKDQIDKIVKNKETKIIIMSASWCYPCKLLSKVVDKLKLEHSELSNYIIKIDIDEHPELAEAFSIYSVPTVLFIKNGDIKVTPGVQSEETLFSFLRLKNYPV